MEHYDLIVIGSGPAGEKAAAQAAYFGRRVAIVERYELTGGVGVTHAGMIPTKTLREAALYITGFRKREIYGVSVELRPDELYSALQRRTNEVIRDMSRLVSDNLDRHGIDLIHGDARLVGGTDVTLTTPGGGTRELSCEVVLIATGSRPFHPPGVPFDDPDVLDAEGVLEIDCPPTHVAVIGGGAIGCEHASIFTALGSHVTLADRGDRLLPYVDAELSTILATTFTSLGMDLRHDTVVDRVERDDDGLRVVFNDDTDIRPDKVLFSAGRVGNIEQLDLDAAGVKYDERGRILVDDDFQTSVRGVYAAGDVIGAPALASTSMEQGRVAACKAFGIDFKDRVDPMPPTGVYSIPEIAAVGLTEQEAEAEGIDYVVGRGWFVANSRANISGAAEGVVKLVFNRTDRALLGVHVLGESATEIIHVGQGVLNHSDAIDYFISTTFNVPTLCEAYKYAAYDGLQHLQAKP